jgi:acylphosphatase
VQGVGFRWFVRRHAEELGLKGWARNQDDGTVEVYAVGYPERLNELAGWLYQGPPQASVRGVEERQAPVQQLNSFHSR